MFDTAQSWEGAPLMGSISPRGSKISDNYRGLLGGGGLIGGGGLTYTDGPSIWSATIHSWL